GNRPGCPGQASRLPYNLQRCRAAIFAPSSQCAFVNRGQNGRATIPLRAYETSSRTFSHCTPAFDVNSEAFALSATALDPTILQILHWPDPRLPREGQSCEQAQYLPLAAPACRQRRLKATERAADLLHRQEPSGTPRMEW